jgi:hypothetical protein
MLNTLIGLMLMSLAAGQAELWGGDHVKLEMTRTGAQVEFDCAHGTIEAPLKPDAKGAFRAKGTFTPERGGPVRDDAVPPKVKATYSGTIKGDAMTLKVAIEGEDATEYTLVRGQEPNLMKCR